MKNQIPVNGYCQVNNKTGLAFETNFTIDCFNWTDSDGFIVAYEFIAFINETSSLISLDKNNLGKSVFKLPSGFLTLKVNVIDDSSGINQFIIPDLVKVDLNNDFINKMSENILNSNIDDLKSSSVQSISSFITSFVSVIDTKSYSNNQSNDNMLIKDILIDVVASLTVGSFDNIDLISNTLSVLTKKTDEISLSSAVSE